MSRFKARSAWLPAGIVGGLAATMLVIAGCGGSSDNNDNGSAQKSVGAGEGSLNLVAWPGYVADPSSLSVAIDPTPAAAGPTSRRWIRNPVPVVSSHTTNTRAPAFAICG